MLNPAETTGIRVFHRCGGCGKKQEFINSGKFRVNANGKAVDAYAQLLLWGMEIQNGFWRLYFPRAALYAGYDIALEYDTVTVKLPDVRHPERFYEVFGHCNLNDSFYFILNFGLTPVVGMFSKYKLESSLRFEKYLRSREFKLKFDIEIKN